MSCAGALAGPFVLPRAARPLSACPSNLAGSLGSLSLSSRAACRGAALELGAGVCCASHARGALHVCAGAREVGVGIMGNKASETRRAGPAAAR